MASIRVTSGLDDLASDLTKISSETRPAMVGVVRDGLKVGTSLAKEYAKASAGPHGQAYFKRISSEMSGGAGLFGNTISGEYGPTGSPKTEFVGVGFRHGHNTDLARSADIVGPSFGRSVGDAAEDLFDRNGF
ncbi:MAG: hypothetical protein JWP74_1761 [Marmoricola sp.]|nr:hypothetical protein [Marmoricola sp.]